VTDGTRERFVPCGNDRFGFQERGGVKRHSLLQAIVPRVKVRMSPSIKIIGCAVMLDEMRSFLPPGADVQVFGMSRHARPKQLKLDLQEAVSDADGTYDVILLGYGLCSNAVVGLRACHSRLVIPKRHDCIGVLLSSHEAYAAEMHTEPAFFLTRGYIRGYREDLSGPADEFDRVAAHHGTERAEAIVGKMMRPYTRLVYLQTSESNDAEADRQYAFEMAARFQLRYEERPGSPELLRQMANGQWGREFVVVEPGDEVTLERFLN